MDDTNRFTNWIAWTSDWLRRNDASFTEELDLLYRKEAVYEWGGCTVNTPATVEGVDGRRGRRTTIPAEVKRRTHADALNSTAPTEEIISRHGISRATFYRLLKKGPPEPERS